MPLSLGGLLKAASSPELPPSFPFSARGAGRPPLSLAQVAPSSGHEFWLSHLWALLRGTPHRCPPNPAPLKADAAPSCPAARERHLGLHLREDPGDGAALPDPEADAPDQDRAGARGSLAPRPTHPSMPGTRCRLGKSWLSMAGKATAAANTSCHRSRLSGAYLCPGPLGASRCDWAKTPLKGGETVSGLYIFIGWGGTGGIYDMSVGKELRVLWCPAFQPLCLSLAGSEQRV